MQTSGNLLRRQYGHCVIIIIRRTEAGILLVAGFSGHPNQAESRRDGGVPRRVLSQIFRSAATWHKIPRDGLMG